MMKRLLSLVLCLMLALPAALAETADTLPKLFTRQMTAGQGVRGYINVSASGVSDWLNLLLPFTAGQIQVRAIGSKQGDITEGIALDDRWQIKLFLKDDAGREAGTSWLYGDPSGVYFQSALLPDTTLFYPVSDVNPLYQLFKGEAGKLFFAFDPLALGQPGTNGNATAYQAIAALLGISEAQWTAQWLPVLEKYFSRLDQWLMGFGASAVVSEHNGSLTMLASYTIPVADIKSEAKNLLSQMVYDSKLLELLEHHTTQEQRVTYLNPQLLYYYEACIDALPLNGNVVLNREMSALGEVVATSIELPLPPMPEKVIALADQAAKAVLNLEYAGLLEGVDRLVLKQSGQERTFILSSSQRTVALSFTRTETQDTTSVNGTFLVAPATGSQEHTASASFHYTHSHRLWQDEKYLNHDKTEVSLSLKSTERENADPLELACQVDYCSNPNQVNAPVQVNLNADVKLPDADLAVEAVLRITTQMEMADLNTTGAECLPQLTDERKMSLLSSLSQNMAELLSSLFHADVEETVPAAGEVPVDIAAPTAYPDAAPTAVPPMDN